MLYKYNVPIIFGHCFSVYQLLCTHGKGSETYSTDCFDTGSVNMTHFILDLQLELPNTSLSRTLHLATRVSAPMLFCQVPPPPASGLWTTLAVNTLRDNTWVEVSMGLGWQRRGHCALAEALAFVSHLNIVVNFYGWIVVLLLARGHVFRQGILSGCSGGLRGSGHE